jgi:hypothetical protein
MQDPACNTRVGGFGLGLADFCASLLVESIAGAAGIRGWLQQSWAQVLESLHAWDVRMADQRISTLRSIWCW